MDATVAAHKRATAAAAPGQEEADDCSWMIDATAAVLGQEEEDDV